MSDTESNLPAATTPPKAADQKHCFSCGAIIHGSAKSCPACGAQQPNLPMASFGVAVSNDGTNEPLPQNHVYCRGCGKPIHKQAPACPKCGAPQSVTGTLPSGRKDRVTAALLAFFLGGFGGHKFYLGQTGMGIFYILFFWTFIPMIVSLIEGIIYLTMSDSEFSTKYI